MPNEHVAGLRLMEALESGHAIHRDFLAVQAGRIASRTRKDLSRVGRQGAVTTRRPTNMGEVYVIAKASVARRARGRRSRPMGGKELRDGKTR